jgi:hypothetical protein
MRRYRAAHPDKFTIAGGRASRATLEKLEPGQCRACRKIYGESKTAKHFVLLKNKKKKWQGWSAECRDCRNKRWRDWREEKASSLRARKVVGQNVHRFLETKERESHA